MHEERNSYNIPKEQKFWWKFFIATTAWFCINNDLNEKKNYVQFLLL